VRFFFSGELDSQIANAYRSTREQVETTLNDALTSAEYGAAIEQIGIIPIILSAKFAVGRKERRLVKRAEKVADYRLFIDFDSFANGSEEERKLLLIENLLNAVTDIERKLKSSFNGARLRQDILALFPEAKVHDL
jgi:hypothetical protein